MRYGNDNAPILSDSEKSAINALDPALTPTSYTQTQNMALEATNERGNHYEDQTRG